MKKLLIFLLLTKSAAAQNTYDVFTYTAPKGYKQEDKNGCRQFTKTENKTGTYCIISLYKQTTSSGNLAHDFDKEWKDLVTPLGVTTAPQKDNGDEITGWKTYSGAANFEFGGSASMALLTTAKKDEAIVCILIVTNNQTFIATDVDAFYNSIKLNNPQQASATQTNSLNVNSNNTKPTSIIGEWLYDDALISILYNYAGHANNDTYNNDVKMTVKNKLSIKADGTYEDYTFWNKGTFKKKEITAKGKYKISGNTIILTPTYHQYIKNDVIQPKDDARNLRPSSASYSFVFDEKANAWGVKFTAADANSYFPDEVYLKADAYKRNASATKSASNVTSTNTGSGILFNNNGIVGVWINYLNLSPGMSNSSMTWNWRIFFADSKCMTNMPNGGFANLASGAYFDTQRNNVEYFSTGSYTFANGHGEMNARANTKFIDKLQLLKANQLKIDGTTFTKSVAVNGQKLSGSFTTYADANNPTLLEQPIGNRSVITFFADGRFIDEGTYQVLLRDYSKDEAYNASGKGTYELKDYSIILKFDDGRVKQEAFSVPLSYTLADAKIILIGRAQLNKMK